jgi:hypothetical protein
MRVLTIINDSFNRSVFLLTGLRCIWPNSERKRLFDGLLVDSGTDLFNGKNEQCYIICIMKFKLKPTYQQCVSDNWPSVFFRNTR